MEGPVLSQCSNQLPCISGAKKRLETVCWTCMRRLAVNGSPYPIPRCCRVVTVGADWKEAGGKVRRKLLDSSTGQKRLDRWVHLSLSRPCGRHDQSSRWLLGGTLGFWWSLGSWASTHPSIHHLSCLCRLEQCHVSIASKVQGLTMGLTDGSMHIPA